MAADSIIFVLPEPEEKFKTLSELEVMDALKRPTRRTDHILTEVSRLVEIYIRNFRIYIEENGIEPFLLEIRVRWPIERVAMKFMIAVLESDNTLVRNRATLH